MFASLAATEIMNTPRSVATSTPRWRYRSTGACDVTLVRLRSPLRRMLAIRRHQPLTSRRSAPEETRAANNFARGSPLKTFDS